MEEKINDQIEICPSNKPPESEESIKSKAVVKFSTVQVPVRFNRLECNTNLNLPPSNWLTTSDSSFGLHQALYHSPGYSSFRMAHTFPDCVGEVDVVSDAENIKKLLKLPYTSKGGISMIVHKVGNTLLLDEFDIQKYLLRKADDDWKWLRNFIREHLLAYGEKDQKFCLKDKSREAIQTKNLLSKFLYRSLMQSSAEAAIETPLQQQNPPPQYPLTGPVLPEPKVEENVPDPKSSHVFNRNVVWTFEDIRMLIGTDMPIFGGPNRPCISLRLRDVSKPINVLTGIDYWLDNLMCNVPEVLMCYHLDGIVQKYEIIKTEDLPFLEGSKFSPHVVRDVAQNILAFLKARATKAGHTYWLFKGRNDDVVKLYDLTSLCEKQEVENDCDEKGENPFTVPVAMLLYSVARNMKSAASVITPRKAGNIKALLENCIKLLPKEKYPQIVTSSHYILSDLHIPDNIDPKSPVFETSDRDSDSIGDDDDDEDECLSDTDSEDEFTFDGFHQDLHGSDELGEGIAIKSICDALNGFQTNEDQGKNDKRRQLRAPAPLIADVETRCRVALEHVSAGIACLKFFNANEENFIKESEAHAKDEEKQRIIHEEQNPTMAKPFKPIPLPFQSLGKPENELNYRKTSISEEDTENSECSSNADIDIKSKKSKKEKRDKKKSQKMTKQDDPKNDSELNRRQPAQDHHHMLATCFNTQLFGSWTVHLKLLLLEKACLTYATLSEYYYNIESYGSSLRAIYMSYRCHLTVIKYMSTMTSQKSCLLGRAGDCFFQMSKNWEHIDKYLEQFHTSEDVETDILDELQTKLTGDDLTNLIEPLKNIEHLLISSCKCYENTIKLLSDSLASDAEIAKHETIRRLGNVRNELGLKYMFWAQEEYNKEMELNEKYSQSQNEKPSETQEHPEESGDPLFLKLAKKSYDFLRLAVDAFAEIRDNLNLAFIYCNLGRFMRFRAHVDIPNERYGPVRKRKKYYNEAIAYYEKAKEALGSRKEHTEIWDSLCWEMSGAIFNFAKDLQDSNFRDETMPVNEIEKEVLDALQKSLKYTEVEETGSRQVLYMYRLAMIHKRIASFHYSQLRKCTTETFTIAKTTLQLCKNHYEKAVELLKGLNDDCECLIVQLERISLQEFLAEGASSNTAKIKQLQGALEIALNSTYIFENVVNTIESSKGQSSVYNDEFHKHMDLFEKRLQINLKTLIKLLLNSKDPKKLADLYKKMYMETLTGKKVIGEQKLTVELYAKYILTTLETLQVLERAHNKIA